MCIPIRSTMCRRDVLVLCRGDHHGEPARGVGERRRVREPGLFGVGVVCRNCTRDGSVAIVRGGLRQAGVTGVELRSLQPPGWA